MENEARRKEFEEKEKEKVQIPLAKDIDENPDYYNFDINKRNKLPEQLEDE